jgi:murein DD-endopeptidase MepM/ murein hydrolase activator NlpD
MAMRLSIVSLLMILTTVFLSGCGKAEMAALDDRGHNFYGKNEVRSAATVQAAPTFNVASRDLTPASVPAQAPAPIAMVRGWQWPVQGRVTEKFGQQANGLTNEGIVIAAIEGTPIRAAQAGEVAFVGQDTKNYGNIVILRHADGTMTSYSHAREITVKKGEQVQGGNVIANVGQSGNAKEPELHFAVREGKISVDPLSKLPQQVASN